MLCVKCHNQELRERRVRNGTVKVDRCPACKGAWLDAGELEALLRVAAKDLRVPPSARKSGLHDCPRCGCSLHNFQYPQTYVKIDMCKECGGMWLDAGEFQEIKAVRRALEKDGTLEEYAQPGGVKGGLLNFIDMAIEALKP